jgi:hypothetical protein
MIVAIAGLLAQQAAPHPSTLEPYRAPAIRPFEPPSSFGRETAEGDAVGDLHRRPLAAPVAVESYARSYEFTPTDVEAAYEQGVASAEIRADQTAGPLDGRWIARDGDGRILFDLVMTDPGGGMVEGGWRSGDRSGFAAFEAGALTLEGRGVVRLERAGDGWRGLLSGKTATLTRP